MCDRSSGHDNCWLQCPTQNLCSCMPSMWNSNVAPHWRENWGSISSLALMEELTPGRSGVPAGHPPPSHTHTHFFCGVEHFVSFRIQSTADIISLVENMQNETVDVWLQEQYFPFDSSSLTCSLVGKEWKQCFCEASTAAQRSEVKGQADPHLSVSLAQLWFG